jgi:hypothetical protein
MESAVSARGVCDNSFNGKPKASACLGVVSQNTDAFGLPLNETL